MMDNLKLKPVSKVDYEFLYELLSEREEYTNISHKEMPTYNHHVKFVKSKPYSKWYIIVIEDQKIGSVYITKINEIGIFLKKEYRNKKLGNKVLKLIMEKNPKERYLANINPKNKKSIQFFKNNGFNLIQYTYELRIKK